MPVNPTESVVAHSKTFACVKCGSPISVYPPDDVHNVASRERSSFPEVVESIGVCSKCNEVTRLYWGKPVACRGLVILLRQLRTTISRRKMTGSRSETEMPGADSISDGEMEQLENQVHDYILDNGGALVLSKAANELGIPVDLVRESVERMTSDGRLKQTGEGVVTQSG